MAKVVVEFDTVEKTMAVTLDGTPVEDVRMVEFCPSYDRRGDWCCSIIKRSEDEAAGIQTWTRMEASLNERQKAIASRFRGS